MQPTQSDFQSSYEPIVLAVQSDNPHSCLPLTNIISLRAQIQKENSLENIALFFSFQPESYLNQSPACHLISHLITDCVSFILMAVAALSFSLCVSALHLPFVCLGGSFERQFDRGTRDVKCSSCVRTCQGRH